LIGHRQVLLPRLNHDLTSDELKFAKVCCSGQPDMERGCLRSRCLGLDSQPATLPMFFAKVGASRLTITITAFERSPDGGRGLARDTRVRWALEEVGQPYEVRLISFGAMKEPAHLALHPFGQIPTYEEGELALFETGSIVFHIAERHAGLLPEDADARARAITWMFAAVNTVEPAILEFANARLLEGDKPWSKERLPLVEGRVRDRLKQLSARLGSADWLDGGFSAGDLMMVSVLLRLKSSGILDGYPNLAAYVARGEARPAYKRAFDAQLAVYAGKPRTG
jgi:glutathione S-transferase